MLSFPTHSSSGTRKRPRSPLKIQTASSLLSVAAVLTVSILPLGMAVSPVTTSTLSVASAASPATSPVIAYFGEDVRSRSADARRSTHRSGESSSENVVELKEARQAYLGSAASYPPSASSFLFQVDPPTEDHSYPHSAPLLPEDAFSRARERRTRHSRRDLAPLVVRGESSVIAAATDDSTRGFAVHNNVASTFSPSSATSGATPSSIVASTLPAASTTPTPVPAAPTSALPLSGTFPQPFDQSLSYSLGDSCVAFLARYLESEEMKGESSGRGVGTSVGRCGRPFGLLVSSSSRWAQMARNETLLNGLLSNICHAADTEGCSQYYAALAVDIQKNANCGADIKRKKAVALEALYGFQNYDMLQTAACLQDSETQAYCYVAAMSTSSPPDDGYLYSLPSGISLPSTSQPTCSKCSAKLLNLFTETVVNAGEAAETQSRKYSHASVMEPALENATAIIKQACGSTFAGQSITMQAHVSSGTVRLALSSWQCWTLPLASALLVAAYSSLGI